MTNPTVFISYRRDDEGPTSRFIKAELDKAFSEGQVFMDVDSIRKGDKWKEALNENLLRCECLIVVIGKNWLKLQDEFFVRRLDKKDDWVRVEIETAIKRKIRIIPLLVGGTIPQKAGLPKSIQKLCDFQAMSLSALTWQTDITALIDLLCEVGFKRKGIKVEFPNPRGVKDSFPLALTPEELNEYLKTLPGWETTYSPIPGMAPKEMQEISKKFMFKSFKDAIAFVNKTSSYIGKVQHHPRWENIWKTLIIHLTTWDIDHRVSKLDIELASYFDKAFDDFYNPKT